MLKITHRLNLCQTQWDTYTDWAWHNLTQILLKCNFSHPHNKFWRACITFVPTSLHAELWDLIISLGAHPPTSAVVITNTIWLVNSWIIFCWNFLRNVERAMEHCCYNVVARLQADVTCLRCQGSSLHHHVSNHKIPRQRDQLTCDSWHNGWLVRSLESRVTVGVGMDALCSKCRQLFRLTIDLCSGLKDW